MEGRRFDELVAALTANERRLLGHVAEGATNARIGERQGRSEKTIRNQLTRVYDKLGVVNRTEAVAVFVRANAGAFRDIRPIAMGVHDE
jgi:two-component system, NarL family, response regulator DevR